MSKIRGWISAFNKGYLWSQIVISSSGKMGRNTARKKSTFDEGSYLYGCDRLTIIYKIIQLI